MPSARPRGRPADQTLRDRIVAVATDLFIRHGYGAVSFLVIARELGITHSNIHYYFRTKADLAEAIVDAYVADTTADFRTIWTRPDATLFDRVVESRDWIWQQYRKFNPRGSGGQDWGLLARFVGEADALSAPVRRTIGRSLRDMEAFIATGIDLAIREGELVADAPRATLVLQISSLLHTSRHITRIDSSFQRLDDLLRWTFEVIQLAYGTAARPVNWPPVPARPRA